MDNDQKIDFVARVAHEANRAWCEAHGDSSQLPWERAESWQKESAKRGIQSVLAGATPRQQHEHWREAKVSDGWIYGPVKDAAKKVHPCLVDYDKLPREHKAKDALYIGAVFIAALQAGLGAPEFTLEQVLEMGLRLSPGLFKHKVVSP